VTLVLYLPVFAMWACTSCTATLYSPSHRGARRMVIAMMGAGLFMNASLTRAFEDAARVFTATLLAVQLGRTAWMLTTDLNPIDRDHFTRTLVWLEATAPLCIVAATISAQQRLVPCGFAAAIDLTGVLLAHPLFHRRLGSGDSSSAAST
jgi:low temperature requirement protein LtrA